MNFKFNIGIIFISIFLFYRPIYLLISFAIFFSEYIYFLNYIYLYKNACKDVQYKSFFINNQALSQLSIYDIWNEINRINAFKKFYFLVLKNKKISIKSILKAMLIIVTGFPLKIYKLCVFLLKSKTILKSSLIELYYVEYSKIQNLKIEIINKKIYINCSTRMDLIKEIRRIHPKLKYAEIYHTYENILKIWNIRQNNLQKYEELQKRESLQLGFLETEEGVKIKKSHYTKIVEKEFEYNGSEYFRLAIHGTSSVPKILTDTQFTALAMQSLIKKEANNPGTILTCGGFTFKKIKNEVMYVPCWQLQRVKYEVGLINNDFYNNIFLEWDANFAEALARDKIIVEKQNIKKFSAGHFDYILQSDSTLSKYDLYEEIKKEVKILDSE